MSGNFKKLFLSFLGFCPEITQGTPNWDLTASGGAADNVTVAAASGHSLYNSDTLGGALFPRLFVYFKSNTTTTALRGKTYIVSTYTWAANVATFTMTGNMDASPQATDTFILYGTLKASGMTLEPKYENLPREDIERQTMDPYPSVKGIKNASGSFTFEMTGLETPNANGATSTPDHLSQFLKCIGTRRSVPGLVCAAGSTTGSINVVSVLTVIPRDLVLINGEVTRVTAVNNTTNALTVSPALSAAPAALDVVYVAERFTPVEEGHQSHTVLGLKDDQFCEMQGCVFNISVSAGYGEKLLGKAEFDAEDWDLTDTYTWSGDQSSKACIVAKTGRTYFGTTQLSTNNFEFNYGYSRTELRDDEINNRYFLTARKATCKVVFRNKNVTPKETWEAAGTADWLLLQRGNTNGAAFAVCGNAQIQDPAAYGDVEQHVYYDATFGFVDDQTYYELPYKPMLARF